MDGPTRSSRFAMSSHICANYECSIEIFGALSSPRDDCHCFPFYEPGKLIRKNPVRALDDSRNFREWGLQCPIFVVWVYLDSDLLYHFVSIHLLLWSHVKRTLFLDIPESNLWWVSHPSCSYWLCFHSPTKTRWFPYGHSLLQNEAQYFRQNRRHW